MANYKTDRHMDRQIYVHISVRVCDRKNERRRFIKEGDLSKLYSFEFSMLDHSQRRQTREKQRKTERQRARKRKWAHGGQRQRERKRNRPDREPMEVEG